MIIQFGLFNFNCLMMESGTLVYSLLHSLVQSHEIFIHSDNIFIYDEDSNPVEAFVVIDEQKD